MKFMITEIRIIVQYLSIFKLKKIGSEPQISLSALLMLLL